MSIYELAILGNVTLEERTRLSNTITKMVEPFGLAIGKDVKLHDCRTVAERNLHAACAAAYFGGAERGDVEIVADLVAQSVPVIPTIRTDGDFVRDIPVVVQGANGLRIRQDDAELEQLAVALLECVGLLRWQRRVFISYRRVESGAAALQLHDLLSGRGYDTFLDTHDIRAGEPFQEMLWNRLCDSDVLLMLDTQTYFDSKWTRHEMGRARAKGIHVLRVVWPGHTATRLAELSETIDLSPDDLNGSKGPLTERMADKVISKMESLRSRSIASRYLSLAGKLHAEMQSIGATVEGIGAHRAISIRLPDDTKIWAYPIVGIPTADLFYDVADKARRANQQGAPILVYDHVGIREFWTNHLKWLDDNIKSVRAIKVAEAGWVLVAWS